MANHKRHRPKSTRAGCLMCKPWKDQRMPKSSRFTHNAARKVIAQNDQLRELSTLSTLNT